MDSKTKITYSEAILSGFRYILNSYPESFVIGQGLWSPWYVGETMTNLDKEFGAERVIDTPVSELACTGAAVGAAICGMKPIIVHPRMDFMLYAMDPIVNQASNWSNMFGAKSAAGLTIRVIINRGGEQGPQHSQALHNWFAHVPGLRVVMPSNPIDACNLLIAAAHCPDPVMYIDDRWLYDISGPNFEPEVWDLDNLEPLVLRNGQDISIISTGFATKLALDAGVMLSKAGINVEIVDVRVISPLNVKNIISSVQKTRRLLVLDVGWTSNGFSGELIARVSESLELGCLLSVPCRMGLPDAPAPSAADLEKRYYYSAEDVVEKVTEIVRKN